MEPPTWSPWNNRSPRGEPAARLPMHRRLVRLLPLAVLLALVAAIGMLHPPFLSLENLSVLAEESSVILLLATAQTLVILLGAIDLSMAALAGLASVLIALALPSMGLGGVVGVLGLTTLLGSLQGYIHARAQLSSVVVTLAGLGIWSGMALVIARATIPVDAGYAAVGWLQGISFGMPHSFAFAATALLILAAGLRWLPQGRYIYAVGLNSRAAWLSGIRVGSVKILAFALTGLFSGLAGMAMVARTYSGNPTIADGLLLPSIAAVVIGGTAMTGGNGGLGRTFIGVLTITVLRVGIVATGVDPAFEPIAYGILVLVAVALTTDRSGVSIAK